MCEVSSSHISRRVSSSVLISSAHCELGAKGEFYTCQVDSIAVGSVQERAEQGGGLNANEP